MPKLSDLLTEKAKADIQVGSSTLSFTYWAMFRQRFSPEEWTDLFTLIGRDHYKMLLPRVIVSWDLTDRDGNPIPITAEAFDQHELPDELLVAYGRRIAGSDLSGKAI